MPRVDDVELAARQPLSQELGVDRRCRLVVHAGDDLHGRADLRQQTGQDRKFGRVGAHILYRPGEPVALVAGHVVLADRVGQHVPLQAGQGGGDQLPRISLTELLQIRRLDPVLEQSAQLKRDRSGAAAHHQAAQPVRVCGRGEQRGRGAGAGPDQVRVIEREGVGGVDDELGHRPRREQRVTALGMTEAGQVDGHQVGSFGQP